MNFYYQKYTENLVFTINAYVIKLMLKDYNAAYRNKTIKLITTNQYEIFHRK